MKTRILVVEDDQIIQFDLQRHLRQLGYEVVGAASRGDEAVAKAAALQPDLVLMDVRLRGSVDGIEAARRIQEARAIPVVYLTAQSRDDVEAGNNGTLEPRIAKPFTARALGEGIERALSGK